MFDEFEATSTEAAERAVIGASLLSTASIRWAAQAVTEDDFSNARLGAIWGVLYRRWKAKEPRTSSRWTGRLEASFRATSRGRCSP